MEEDKKPFKHEMHVLSKEEVLDNRCSAYEFIDFDKQETLEDVASDIQNQCHSFVESVISSKISYRDATDIFLFMKLAELTIKLKQYEK